MSPKRIQRKRTAGWRMPEGAVYVGRPTKWGNLFKLGEPSPWGENAPMTRADVVEAYRYLIGSAGSTLGGSWEANALVTHLARRDLHGRDLACWCPLDQPCHADVLLQIANDLPLGNPRSNG